MFLRDLQRTLGQDRLIHSGDHVLVGVSGGADSVALLVGLQALAPASDLTLTCAHLDHRLRGADSAADAASVMALAGGLDIPCIAGRSDVRGRARRKGISIEMAAREARYDFFVRSARRCGATAIATAHTADDQAETLLLRMARGTGVDGLGGIPPSSVIRGLRLVRPLLELRRAAIEGFLVQRGIEWREDASNHDPAHRRNRVRHELLPWLRRELNPGVTDALCRLATTARDDSALLDETCRALMTDFCLPDGSLRLAGLAALPTAAQRRIVRAWMVTAGVDIAAMGFDGIERLLVLAKRKSGGRRSLPLPSGPCITREYGRLRIEDVDAGGGDVAVRCRLASPGETLIPELGLAVTVSREPGGVKDVCRGPGALPACASISRRAVGRKQLYLRTWKPGDRMAPLGMRGSQKLQDIFINEKVPASHRARVALLECGGEIVWIPGYRVARGWEVRAQDRTAVRVSMRRAKA